jgi:hypothetical protein
MPLIQRPKWISWLYVSYIEESLMKSAGNLISILYCLCIINAWFGLWNHTEYSCCELSPLNVSVVHPERLCWPWKGLFLVVGTRPSFLRYRAMKTAACHNYCREGHASAFRVNCARKLAALQWSAGSVMAAVTWALLEKAALGSSLPTVVGRVRAGGCDVSTLGVVCASRLAGTPDSSMQAGLHLPLMRVLLLNPLTFLRYGCPFLTIYHLTELDPIAIGTAMFRTDWLDGRSLEGWHSE